MIGDIKKAFRKTAVYSLGNMGTKLIGLILIPLYTDQDYLTVSDYGALGVLEITAQVLVALMSFTLSRALPGGSGIRITFPGKKAFSSLHC